jgi:hypothetical protein
MSNHDFEIEKFWLKNSFSRFGSLGVDLEKEFFNQNFSISKS